MQVWRLYPCLMSATKIRLTAVIMDVLDVITSSPSDNPAWGLLLCEQTGYGTGTIYPALDRLMKSRLDRGQVGRTAARRPASSPLLHGHLNRPRRLPRSGRRPLGSPGGLAAGPSYRGDSVKTAPASRPGDDDGDGQRRFIPMTLDSFRRPDDFAWRLGKPELADAAHLQACKADDHSTPFLHGSRVEDLRAALDSMEREGRLYADSGVDLVRVVDGQVLVGQAKTRASNRRRGWIARLLPRGRAKRRSMFKAILSGGLAGLLIFSSSAPVWMRVLGALLAVLIPLRELAVPSKPKIRARKKLVEWPLTRFTVQGLTDLASLLAGRRRPALRAEWRTHLAGESGHDPVTWRKVREAGGFVASAVRCRCSDAADAAWAPADAVLRSRTLSNLFTLMPAALAALILFRHGGTIGLLGSAESVSAIYLMFYALVLAGRKYRNVKPPEPKARRAKE